MEYVIANIGYFLEILMIQIYAELIWKQKLCFRGFSWALFVVNGVILTGVNWGVFPKFFVLVVHISLYAYLWIRCKVSIREKVAKTCVTFVLAWGTEMVSGIILSLVIYRLKEYELILILVNGMSFALAVLFTVIIKQRKNRVSKTSYYKNIRSIIICLMPFVVVILTYVFNHEFYVVYNFFIIIYMAIVFIYFDKVQKAEYEILRKEMELTVNRVYGGMYEEIINNIRRKQHNYKDQIAAIYSTHKTAQSLEELIERQKEYCDIIQEDSRFDFILTSCHEPILAGFIYYKCLEGLSRNIKIDCRISVKQWDCEVKLYELVEMLGILFNNAFEYVTENKSVGKDIYFACIEEEKFYNISIDNEIDADIKIDFNKMFEMQYSTKGEGRGFGLPRIKEICDFYGLKIKIAIENCKGKRIKFEIKILK